MGLSEDGPIGPSQQANPQDSPPAGLPVAPPKHGPRKRIVCQRVMENRRIQRARSKAISLGWGGGRLEGDMGLSKTGR